LGLALRPGHPHTRWLTAAGDRRSGPLQGRRARLEWVALDWKQLALGF